MIGIEIRPAAESEREWSAYQMSVSDPWITLGVTLDQCRKTCSDPEYKLYIALLDNESTGMILLDPRGVAGSPYIKTILVSSEFRGKGIGEALISFTENLYRNENKHLFLCVSSFNLRARTFYERLGFREAGEFKDYIIDGKSEILMHKRIH